MYINGIRTICSTYSARGNLISNLTESAIGRNKMEILTTVWWLTWMTSSPAWIFLQRSARDWWRGRETGPLAARQSRHTAECERTPWIIRHEYAVIKKPSTCGSTRRFTLTPSVVPVMTCKPSYVDLIYMPCGRINTAVSAHFHQDITYVVRCKGKFVLVKEEQQWTTRFQGFTLQSHSV